MKKITQFLAIFALAVLSASAQNVVVRNGNSVTTVFLSAAPTGDCRQQYYLIAYDNSYNQWVCNVSNGTWTQSSFAGTSGSTGTGAVVLQTSPTITTPVIGTITNTGTESVPSNSGGIPVVIACGSTTTGSGTCANTASGHTAQVYFGAATLASNAQTVTISPGFTATGDFYCVGNDVTTRANPVQVVPASATTFTITNTTGASDVVQWICVGY